MNWNTHTPPEGFRPTPRQRPEDQASANTKELDERLKRLPSGRRPYSDPNGPPQDFRTNQTIDNEKSASLDSLLAYRAMLHMAIEDPALDADDLRLLIVLLTAFQAVPPGSLFRRLRNKDRDDRLPSPESPQSGRPA